MALTIIVDSFLLATSTSQVAVLLTITAKVARVATLVEEHNRRIVNLEEKKP